MKAIKSLFGGHSKGKKSPRSNSNASPDVEENSVESVASISGAAVPSSQAKPTTSTTPAQTAENKRQDEAEVSVSVEVMDNHLEAAINLAMDFLANEGLETPNLFRSVPVQRTVEECLSLIRKGEQVDFIARNDAPLTIAVLLECMKGISRPVFPTHLLESLSEAQRISRQDPIEKRLQRLHSSLYAREMRKV
jgi:hypothetical protein